MLRWAIFAIMRNKSNFLGNCLLTPEQIYGILLDSWTERDF